MVVDGSFDKMLNMNNLRHSNENDGQILNNEHASQLEPDPNILYSILFHSDTTNSCFSMPRSHDILLISCLAIRPLSTV